VKEDNNKEITEEENKFKEIGMKSFEKLLDEREFFQSGYYNSLGIMFFTFLTFISSIGYLLYAVFVYQPPISYIALNEEQRLLEEKPLDKFHLTKEEVVQWNTDAILDIYSYNHLSIDTHGNKVSKYFVDTELSKFMTDFNGLNLQKIVEVQKAIVVPEILKSFEFDASGSFGGKAAAVIKGIIFLKIHGTDGIKGIRYEVDITVSRVPFSVQKDGLSIVSIQTIKM
jgi:hypothetical protein